MSSRYEIKHLGGAMFWENNQSDGVKLLSPCWSVWFPLKSNSLPLNCNFFFLHEFKKITCRFLSISSYVQCCGMLWICFVCTVSGIMALKKKKAVLGFSKISIWIYVIYSTVNKYSPPLPKVWLYFLNLHKIAHNNNKKTNNRKVVKCCKVV